MLAKDAGKRIMEDRKMNRIIEDIMNEKVPSRKRPTWPANCSRPW